MVAGVAVSKDGKKGAVFGLLDVVWRVRVGLGLDCEVR